MLKHEHTADSLSGEGVLPSPALSTTSPPSAKTPELPDSVFDFCRSPQSFLLELARKAGPVARFRLNGEQFAVLGDADALHEVFTGSFDDFEKGELYDIIDAAFGDSIFTVDQPEWSELHDVLAPLFSRARVQAMQPVVASVVAEHVQRWEFLARNDQPIELLTSMKRLSFDVVARGLVGIRDPETADALFAVLHRADRTEAVRLKYLGKRVPAVRTQFRRSPIAEQIDGVASAIANNRIAGDNEQQDLLSDMMATAVFQDMPAQQKPKFVRDFVCSMLSAGYVTTGEGLFWTLYLLALHPSAQDRAYSECQEAAGAGLWTSAVISESLRLYPPAWFLGRITRRAVRVAGHEFEAGVRLICSGWVLHRMPALWPDPDAFRPERFLPGGAPVAPRSYVPFGSGRRGCIGRALALMELMTLIPEVLSRFELRLTDETPVSLAATFSMQPSRAVYLHLKSR